MSTLQKTFVFGGAALLVIGIIVFSPIGQTAKWVGHTDLQVRFVVTDVDTGQPIPNAIVHVRAEPGGFCEDNEAREFTITTDENGHAEHLCKSCMSCGSSGIFENTFAVYLPYWWFHATAAEYSGTDPAYLDVLENRRQVRRGEKSATIEVPIRLQRSAP